MRLPSRARGTLLILTALSLSGACSAPASPTSAPPAPTVTPPLAAIDRGNLGVSPSTALLVPGQSEQYVALPPQIFTKVLANVTWSVDNPAVASVTADGYLVAKAPGFTWLRAAGVEGTAAHPISVDRDPPILARGKAKVESCTEVFAHACKGAVSNSSFDLYLKYRVVRGGVVAESWWGSNDLSTTALFGTISDSGQFTFFEPAFLTPVVSRGAGGCCSALTQVAMTANHTTLTEGTFLKVSSNTTTRFRIVKP